MRSMRFGYEEGEICNRNGCKGTVQQSEKGVCCCHINPPCSACTEPRGFCEECKWDEKDDRIINNHVVNVDKVTGVFKSSEPRKLDSSKIDWRYAPHTHFTMIKEGVYPEGTSIEEVRKVVDGTFGGRFESFGGGKFKFIAYTD